MGRMCKRDLHSTGPTFICHPISFGLFVIPYGLYRTYTRILSVSQTLLCSVQKCGVDENSVVFKRISHTRFQLCAFSSRDMSSLLQFVTHMSNLVTALAGATEACCFKKWHSIIIKHRRHRR